MGLVIKNIIFLDIETVAQVPEYDLLSPGLQKEWTRKVQYLRGFEDESAQREKLLFEDRAGIYAEFGQVVCIGLGALIQEEGEWKLALKSLQSENEFELLSSFLQLLERMQKDRSEIIFCGHNIKEFDLPYLCRRILIHRLPLPSCLQLSHKKPWEIVHKDTLELWRFGDYKHYISLNLLAQCLSIPTPKDDIDGSMVNEVYWKQKDLPRISTYCLKDVSTTAKVFLRLNGHQDIVFTEKFV